MKKWLKMKKKAQWTGLAFLGYWDGEYWAMKEDVKGLPYHGGTLYTLN